MVVSFSYGGSAYHINPRHIACLMHSTAGKGGPVNVTIYLTGIAQPLTLQLPPEQFAELSRAFDAACAEGSIARGCAEGKVPTRTGQESAPGTRQ